jgi:hypothetical protein
MYETEEGRTEFWWGNLRETDHLEDLGLDGNIMVKWIFKNCDGVGRAWTGFIWLRTGTRGQFL